MKEKIITKNTDWISIVARLTVGFVIIPHGAQKMTGSFSGMGFSGTMAFFTETLHLPWIIGFLVILTEFFGAFCLIIGFASRFWAMAMIILFIGIILMVHFENGFFMNWFGVQKGEGYEFDLLVIGLSAIVLITGSGTYSLNGFLQKKYKNS